MKKISRFSDRLGCAINCMMQDDATGEVFAFSRESSGLVANLIRPEDLLTGDLQRFEMVLFDGGNTHGDSWKHVFFPRTQQEFFTCESEVLPETILSLVEHSSPNYSPRTYHNANSADLTVALACDFSTAGEKLTHKAAGSNYLGVPIQFTPQDTAKMILFHLHERGLANPTINIAGNGIYTLTKKLGWSQHAVNLHVTHALALAHREIPIKQIVSGGQTGVDIAGIVAAHLLKIDAEATFPKGFVQRFEDGKDICRTEADIRREVIEMADAIRNDLAIMLDAKQEATTTAKITADPAPHTSAPQDEFNFGF